MTDVPRVFIGWDSREDIAYQVCRSSILRHASGSVEVRPLKQSELREQGLYRREEDPLASTEFTYTRFLTPYLAGFEGWAIFVDCDFLYTADIQDLWAQRDPSKAVMCVQHDYQPTEATKMDGKAQTVYPRKNWSSMMLMNCGHPSTRKLTVEAVNSEGPAYLHRMLWADDAEIGALDKTWNWLEGWYAPEAAPPKAIHYTRGGPWFEAWRDVDYGALWLAERDRVVAAGAE
ncbi:MAG: glycosyltransferase [Pseudomonadota bacterium]